MSYDVRKVEYADGDPVDLRLNLEKIVLKNLDTITVGLSDVE